MGHLAALTMLVVVAGCLNAPEAVDKRFDAAMPVVDASDLEVACVERFSAANLFRFCGAMEDACTFFSATGSSTDFTCAQLCLDLGGACLTGFDSSSLEGCEHGGDEDGCDALHGSQVCVCTL